MADQDGGEGVEPHIAHRTRSHLRIDGFEPNDNLDFPDVDMNLYQNPDSEGDTEYKKFLNQCYSSEIATDPATDDNDPEYVYNDDIFSHGWRYDINEVIQRQQLEESLGEFHNMDGSDNSKVASTLELQPLADEKSPIKQSRRRLDMFAEPEFARILNQQLRQHIQLLAQTYLLTKFTTNMRDEAEEAKNHLESYMKIFKNKSKPSNLLPTIELVNNLPIPKDIKSSIRLSWRPLPIPPPVSSTIRDNPHIFMYPGLLPKVAFSFLPEKLLPKKPKINFTLNEDKLLAYALNEFKGESSPHAFIASLLMTAKTKTQISNHIKNIKRSQGCENNPIKLYCNRGILPHIDLSCDSSLSFQESSSEMPVKVKIEKLDSTESEDLNRQEQITMEVEASSIHTEQVVNPDVGKDPAQVAQYTTDPDPEPPVADEFYGQSVYSEHDDLMNMDLDDLMAASTTISKSAILNANNTNESNKSIRNSKLKKSMINLMSHNFLLSSDMGDLITCDFLKSSQQVLSERDYFHLLQLLSDLMRRESKNEGDDLTTINIYKEIIKFLQKLDAPHELREKMVLFLDLNQANQCGCSESYLHWMRFFQFMQHIELYHDGTETFEKKLVRLIDSLQKNDTHKIKLAIGNLVNKHPFLKREFESLSLEEKPHPSLFICDEDFDDITEPISTFTGNLDQSDNLLKDQSESKSTNSYEYEQFTSKMSKEELSYATQSCPCGCHQSPETVIKSDSSATPQQLGQHCEKCNIKFMKGRMYLVNKIKPLLAEWSYSTSSTNDNQVRPIVPNSAPIQAAASRTNDSCAVADNFSTDFGDPHVGKNKSCDKIVWSFEEDREILEFCRAKAEQNEEAASFDTTTFEELVNDSLGRNEDSVGRRKSAKEIAGRFNQLMDMYREESSDVI